MAKKNTPVINLIIPAGKANPSPPIGPALGQHGVNIAGFCKEFNDRTKELEAGIPIRVEITVAENKKFTFSIKTSPASYYLKKLSKNNQVTMEDCREIAKIKLVDLNAYDIECGAKMIKGTALSMNLEVVGN